MEATKKRCKNCGKILKPSKGRSDRQYCDEKCKNQYHNAKNARENAELQRIELILRKNHRILKKMFLRKDKDTIPKERLLKEGFNFDYHTHHIIGKIKGNEFIFCHGYGYLPSPGGNQYRIIKAFEHSED